MSTYDKQVVAAGKIAKEGMSDIALVMSDKGFFEKKEQRIPVGTFGIVTSDGVEHTITWVENNFRKKKPAEQPEKRSDWMMYQIQSMFAKWNKEETTCQDTQVV